MEARKLSFERTHTNHGKEKTKEWLKKKKHDYYLDSAVNSELVVLESRYGCRRADNLTSFSQFCEDEFNKYDSILKIISYLRL